MAKRKKLTAVLLAVFIVFSFTLSFLFVVACSEHACSKGDCPVCGELTACLNSFSAEKLLLILSVIGIIVIALLKAYGFKPAPAVLRRTPVKMKVLMLN